jgi:hypothetical protein
MDWELTETDRFELTFSVFPLSASSVCSLVASSVRSSPPPSVDRFAAGELAIRPRCERVSNPLMALLGGSVLLFLAGAFCI